MTQTGDIDAIRDGLHSEDEETTKETLRSLIELGADDWSALEPLVDDLLEVFDDSPFVCQKAAGTIARIGSLEENQAIELGAYADPYEDLSIACRAIDALAYVSRESPADVAPALPEIVAFLELRDATTGEVPEAWTDEDTIFEHESRRAQQYHQERRWKALATIERVVEDDPTALHEVTDDVFALLERPDRARVQAVLLETLAIAAEESPAQFESLVEPLAALLEDTDRPTVRANAAYVLALLAEAHQDAVTDAFVDRSGDVFEMLMLGEDAEVNGAIGLLSYAAERDPEAVEPATDTVIDLLDHSLESIRGNAIWTLSYVGGDEAAAALETVADEDPSEQIRAHAAEVRDQLLAESD